MARKKIKDSQSFYDEAKKVLDRIAADRDKLRELVQEYESIADEADEACRCFEDGLEYLSRQL